ncbi:hypothetical protein HK098_004331 [Nowakowskiella sp. JEL0407]|nr:hypothetical protein HK098_004331 [Nowakowskiella sp. JEL0407]
MNISYENVDNVYITQAKFNHPNINSSATNTTDLTVSSNDTTKISNSTSLTNSPTPFNVTSANTSSSSATIGNNVTQPHLINIDVNLKNGRTGVAKNARNTRVQRLVAEGSTATATPNVNGRGERLKDGIDALIVTTIYVFVNMPWSWMVFTYTITTFLVGVSLLIIPIIGVPVYLGMAWTWRWCARINCVILSAVVPHDARYPGVLMMPAIDFTAQLGPRPSFRQVFNNFALAKSTWGVVVYFVIKPLYVTFAACLMLTLGVTSLVILPLFWMFGLLSLILNFFLYLAIIERRFTMGLTGAVVVKSDVV